MCKMKNTIYECSQKGVVVYSGDTEEDAVNWLEQNGGGLFKNILHNYQYTVNAGGKK